MNRNRILTDQFYDLKHGTIKYQGITDEINKFVQNEQLLDKSLWENFVEQYRSNVDDCDKGWRCEYFGKMMRGAALTYQYTKSKELYNTLKDAVTDMLSTQDNLGRFSTYSVDAEFDGWDLWGRKYVMLGFMYYYEICKDNQLRSQILNALIKHADYIVEHIGANKIDITKATTHWGGLNSCSILEPFVKLYNMTKYQRYLDFATYIVSTGFNDSENIIDLAYEKTKAPYQFKYTKAYEMMSCFQGLLEYYRVTKCDKHLQAVVNFVDMVIDTDVSVIGTTGCTHELFDNSKKRQTEYIDIIQFETCVTATWMNLCYQLLCFTGNPKYADLIELSAVNGMFGAVNTNKNKTINIYSIEEKRNIPTIPNSKIFIPFDSYSPVLKKQRATGTGGYKVMANNTFYGCCACIGSLGTALASLYGVMESKDGFVINYYEKGSITLVTKLQNVKVRIFGNLLDGKINLKFKMRESEMLNLKLRIPSWSTNTIVKYKDVNYPDSNSYFQIKSIFTNDDVIEILFDSSLKIIKQDNMMAFKKGPFVLARDERYDEDIDSPVLFDYTKPVVLKKIKTNKFKTIAEYQIKQKDTMITVCDYASAGKDWDRRDKKRITVWMD